MTPDRLRFDDDGYLDMGAFDGVDPDGALAPEVLTRLREAMGEPDPETAGLDDSSWGELLDQVFDADPDPQVIDLVEPIGDESASGPIDLEGDAPYEGRSADDALESARTREADSDSDGAGDREHRASLIDRDDQGGEDGGLGDDEASTDWGLDDVLPDRDDPLDLDDADDDGVGVIDLDDTY